MIEFGCVFALGFAAGGVLIWFCKTRLQALVVDTNALAARLRAEADAVAARMRKS